MDARPDLFPLLLKDTLIKCGGNNCLSVFVCMCVCVGVRAQSFVKSVEAQAKDIVSSLSRSPPPPLPPHPLSRVCMYDTHTHTHTHTYVEKVYDKKKAAEAKARKAAKEVCVVKCTMSQVKCTMSQ